MAYSIYMYFSIELLPCIDNQPDKYPRLNPCFGLRHERMPINDSLLAFFKPRENTALIREYLNECLNLPTGILLCISEDRVSVEKLLLKKHVQTPEFKSLVDFYREIELI